MLRARPGYVGVESMVSFAPSVRILGTSNMEAEMKRWALILGIALLAACGSDTPTSPSVPSVPAVKHANVVFSEGPIMTQDDYTIDFKGTVKNTGQRQADYVKIYIYIRMTDGTLIEQNYSYADDYNLAVNESSPWEVSFWDYERTLRSRANLSKTTYEIKWEEY